MKNNISIKKAALINATGKYSKILLTVIVNAILARILTPNDFGIVAVITVFSTFFSTISDMGFGTAIIQNKTLTKKDINNIYSFTVYISFFLMIFFSLSSYPISIFYQNKVYINLGYLLSISLFFNAMNMVPNGVLNREKEFKIIAKRTVIVYFFSSIVTILLALLGLKYYSLAIQSVLTAFFTFVWNFFTVHPKFIYNFSMVSIRKVLSYSSYQFAFNIVNYFSRNLDNLLTGKFMGSVLLGYYDKAYTLMLYPVNNLTGVVSPVLHPILSDFQNDYSIIYKKYIKVFKILFCVGIWVTAVCFLCSKEIITIMYGRNWNDSIECFKLLSLAILPQMVNSSAGGIFQAIGNTRLLFINSCINTLFTVLAILVGVFYGKSITALSLYVSISYILQFFTAFYMLVKIGFGYNMTKFIKDIKSEFVILAAMIVAVTFFHFSLSGIFWSFIFKFIYLSFIFIFLIYITKEDELFKRIL